MKHFFLRLLFLVLFLSPGAFASLVAQDLPPFSDLSGRSCRDVSAVQVEDGFLFRLRYVVDGEAYRVIYKVDHAGQITDSLSLLINDSIYTGLLLTYGDRCFLTGMRNLLPDGTNQEAVIASQEKFLMELGDNLEVLSIQTYDVLPPASGPVFETAGLQITIHQPFAHRIINDTLYSVKYLTLFDTMTLFPIGQGLQYDVVGLDGSVYLVQNGFANVGTYFNAEIGDDRVFIFGDVAESSVPGGGLLNTRPVGIFDLQGGLIGAYGFDEVGSAGFSLGSSGQWRDGLLFTTYYGENIETEGCQGSAAAIDIRQPDSLTLVKRFKVPDCGIYPGGNDPFGFAADGGFYYTGWGWQTGQIGIYRYDANYDLVWGKLYDLENHLPIAIYETPDGGILLACLDRINPIEQWLMLYKMNGDGDILSSTRFPASLASEPVSFYPNPFQGQVQLSAFPGEGATLVVSDLQGRSFGNYAVQGQAIQLDHLPAGTYVVSLFDGAGRLGNSQVMVKY